MTTIIMANWGNVLTVLAFFLLTSIPLRAVNAKDVHLQITQCPEKSTDNISGHGDDQCTYHIDPGVVETLKLDCLVQGAPSIVSLLWVDQNGDNVTTTKFEVREEGNGTFDSTATMTWPTTDVDDGMVFTCVGQVEAVAEGSLSKNVTVVVEEGDELPLWLLIVIIVSSVVGLFLVVLCACIMCRYRRSLACCFGGSYEKAPQNEEFLEIQNNLAKMREQLKSYKPEYVGTVDLRTEIMTVGLFGPSGGGKTELVNSLMFALQGRYKPIPKRTADESTDAPVREKHLLTEHIQFIEDHGVDIFGKKLDENIAAEIPDDEDTDTDALARVKIHCPVLVMDTSNGSDVDKAANQVIMFAKNVKQLYGSNLKIVITHNPTIDTEDAESIATKVGLSSGVVEGDIYVVENYTPKRHKEDPEKSLAMLKFLQGCLKAGEENLVHEIKSETRNRLLNIVGMQAQQRR